MLSCLSYRQRFYFELDYKWRFGFLGAVDDYPPCDVFIELIGHNELHEGWQ